MQKLDGLCRQVADRKCPPSQLSPHWRPVAWSGEGAGTGLGGAATTSPAGARPGTGSCSSAGGPPEQTPGAPSPSEAQRSPLPALPSPPPVCLSPVGGGTRQMVGKELDSRTKMAEKHRSVECYLHLIT